MKFIKNTCYKKNGQSMVETALVLPLIVLFIMSIIDFGMMFSNYLVITNASREGARAAAVGYSDDEVKSTVTSRSATLDSTKLEINIYPEEAVRKKGDDVSVSVEYKNALLTPVISAILPDPVNLKTITVMRME